MASKPLNIQSRAIHGSWQGDHSALAPAADAMADALTALDRPIILVEHEGETHLAAGGQFSLGGFEVNNGNRPLLACSAPLTCDRLGDPNFLKRHGLRYAYVAGAMANGITSEAIVEEMARAGMLGFFGAAGLPIARIEAAIDRLQANVGDLPYGFNLIHSPSEPAHEDATVDLYLDRGVHLVSASAYLRLTLPIVRYRVTGIHRNEAGEIVTPNRVVAKVSRVEVARQFFSPPPEKFLKKLLEAGVITEEQAELARQIPMAEDLSAEADSGGHTDNRPALALFSTMATLRDELTEKFEYTQSLCVGLGGGIATPAAAAAAFAMGAAYVLTGSVNQSCMEAGTSEAVRQILAKAGQADVMMAPAADMFEMGVNVQVLKWGTMFPVKGRKLYEWYRSYESIESMPAEIQKQLEEKYFLQSVDEVWAGTKAFFTGRGDLATIEKAERDPKHKMALLFRSYLGQASIWAIKGLPERKADYQVWCGPAMGAFNEWVAGTEYEPWDARHVADVARNLLVGAAVLTRVADLRRQGVCLPRELEKFRPLSPERAQELIERRVTPDACPATAG